MSQTQRDIALTRRFNAMTKLEKDALRAKAIACLEMNGELERCMWRLLRWECEDKEQETTR